MKNFSWVVIILLYVGLYFFIPPFYFLWVICCTISAILDLFSVESKIIWYGMIATMLYCIACWHIFYLPFSGVFHYLLFILLFGLGASWLLISFLEVFLTPLKPPLNFLISAGSRLLKRG